MSVDKEYIDEQIAKLGDFDQYFTKKEIKYLPELINDGENILAMTSGFLDGNTWLIVVTDRRLLFLDKGMIYGLKQVEMPLDKISGISHKIGMLMGQISVMTSGGTQKIENILKTDVPKIARIISDLTSRENKTSTKVAPSISSNNSEDDFISKLERLAKLKEQGILTEEEFFSQKARILSVEG